MVATAFAPANAAKQVEAGFGRSLKDFLDYGNALEQGRGNARQDQSRALK
jgi:hypothetical protein